MVTTDQGYAQTQRFEGISLLYLGFFVLAVMAPSIITHDYFGIPRVHLQESLIFLMGLSGLLTFTLYERVVEKRVAERDQATQSAERATKELVESYQYIGSMNRQLEVLKKLANETSMSLVKSDTYWKDLLQSLASNAASCADAERVLLRYVELDRLRTEREVSYSVNDTRPLRVANKELRQLHESGLSYAFICTETGEEVLVVPSDTKHKVKAYVIVARDSSQASDLEISLLRVLANQAELVYHTLIRPKETLSPLLLVEAVTAESVGEVS